MPRLLKGIRVLDSPYKLLGLLLPTVLLFLAFSQTALEDSLSRREVFGSADTYLDIRFDSASHRTFKGQLITDAGEEKIHGILERKAGKTQYVFVTSYGRFTGTLKSPQRGCEPVLEYEMTIRSKKARKGSLRAGFCL